MVIRVAVVDRRRLVREGLVAALATHPGIEAVAGLGDAVDVYLWGEVSEPAPTGVRVLALSDEETIEGLVARVRGHVAAPERSILTRRETQVIDALSAGLPTGEIAGALGIGAKSVDHHKQRAYAKLGVHSAAQAVLAVAGATR